MDIILCALPGQAANPGHTLRWIYCSRAKCKPLNLKAKSELDAEYLSLHRLIDMLGSKLEESFIEGVLGLSRSCW